MEKMDRNLIVKLIGELDHHSSEMARKKIDKYYSDNNMLNMIMDLNELSFMDSSGIGLIMGRYKNVLENRGELLIVCTNESIKRILDMSGLLKIINQYPSLDVAYKNI